MWRPVAAATVYNSHRSAGEPLREPGRLLLHGDDSEVSWMDDHSGSTASSQCLAASRSLSRPLSISAADRATGSDDHHVNHHTLSSSSVAAQGPPGNATKKRIRFKTERRREQCRLNQARYRNKQRSFAVALEHEVAQLQQHVRQLEAQRQSLHFSVNTRESVTRLAVEYFRFFSGGLTVWAPRPGSQRPTLEQQIQFVTSTFRHDIRVGDDVGCEFFLEQWRRFSTFYDGLRILPRRFILVTKTDVSSMVEAKVSLQVTISESTIRQLYPHLQHARYSSIKRKMLGQRVDFSSSLEFVFDHDDKVVSVEWTIDFVDALGRFLTIEETTLVLQQAQVVRDAYLLESRDDRHSGVRCHTDSDQKRKRTSPNVVVILQAGASDQNGSDDDMGFLIHDGKGDDYVMV